MVYHLNLRNRVMVFYEFGYRLSGNSVEPRGPQVELVEQNNSSLANNNNQPANEIHLTAEELKEVIRTAMDKWDVCSGYFKP
jgi:hypothetical protein|tara:strand:- start:3474 stop:3719 length:246 start_codon:yes stop_codon:yes gene_type:complete